MYKNVLVVGSDKLFKIVDWNDWNIVVLFGDGVGVVVMGVVLEGKGVLFFELGVDGSGGKYFY